jgi:hypothetical protein
VHLTSCTFAEPSDLCGTHAMSCLPGHTAHRDQPDRFLAEVATFLNSVCGQ